MKSLQHKLFMMMLLIIMIMLIFDTLSRFDGNPGTIYPFLNSAGNFLVFFISPVTPSLWLLYVHNQIYHDEGKTKMLSYPLIALNAVNMVLVLLSLNFKWFYYIDSNNIYHRGQYYLLPASFTIALILVAFIMIIINRKKIEKKHFFSLVFFAVPPSICIFLQIAFYGASLILNGVVFSLLIVFLSIQNQSMHTDYLTGVSNRKKLDDYMEEKINTSTENNTFSSIIIDMDNFKTINDTFGHSVGDEALKTFTELLKSCIRGKDFIARFGGDEFFIVLDISDNDCLKTAIQRLKGCIDDFNSEGSKPYQLEFSMGYAVYDFALHMKVREFQKMVDELMYEDKRSNKEAKSFADGLAN
ncbi:MAG: GGDEF domain-containing protein [Clostridiaceae bacterium]